MKSSTSRRGCGGSGADAGADVDGGRAAFGDAGAATRDGISADDEGGVGAGAGAVVFSSFGVV